MAHFAVVDKESKKVVRVIVVNNNRLLLNEQEDENTGILFLESLYRTETPFVKTINPKTFYSPEEVDYVQTSYNNNFRKNFAGVGYNWDDLRNAFISPMPNALPLDKETLEPLQGDWILNEETCKWDFKLKK